MQLILLAPLTAGNLAVCTADPSCAITDSKYFLLTAVVDTQLLFVLSGSEGGGGGGGRLQLVQVF